MVQFVSAGTSVSVCVSNVCCLLCMCQCSVSCGEGLQHRVVRCVVEDSDSVENSLCEQSSRPDTLRKCHMQECQTNTGKTNTHPSLLAI